MKSLSKKQKDLIQDSENKRNFLHHYE